MNEYLPKKEKLGFTLLEVITAIFILTVGIGGAFALLRQSLSGASMVELKVTAAYLAQEGIEIVRNIRDSNWLESRSSSVSWDDGLTNCQSPNCCEGDYKIYTSLTNVSNCNSSNLRYLNIDTNGFYSYDSGTPTKFKRKIIITPKGSDKMEVKVIVEWQERERSHSIEVVEDLSNWYER